MVDLHVKELLSRDFGFDLFPFRDPANYQYSSHNLLIDHLHWGLIYTELNKSKLIEIEVDVSNKIMRRVGKDQLVSLGRYCRG